MPFLRSGKNIEQQIFKKNKKKELPEEPVKGEESLVQPTKEPVKEIEALNIVEKTIEDVKDVKEDVKDIVEDVKKTIEDVKNIRELEVLEDTKNVLQDVEKIVKDGTSVVEDVVNIKKGVEESEFIEILKQDGQELNIKNKSSRCIIS